MLAPNSTRTHENACRQVKEYFNTHYDELQLPPIVSEYFAQV